jgi:hypothetical protein
MRAASLDNSGHVTHRQPGRKQVPNPMRLLNTERGNPIRLPSGTVDREVYLWPCGRGMPEEAKAAL